MMKFYNRDTELALLRDLTQRSAQFSQFTAIFGRRRVGKTELVRQHLRNRGLYFFVEKRPSNALLAEFSAYHILDAFHLPAVEHLRIGQLFVFSQSPRH